MVESIDIFGNSKFWLDSVFKYLFVLDMKCKINYFSFFFPATCCETIWFPRRTNVEKPHLTASLWLYCGAHGMRYVTYLFNQLFVYNSISRNFIYFYFLGFGCQFFHVKEIMATLLCQNESCCIFHWKNFTLWPFYSKML